METALEIKKIHVSKHKDENFWRKHISVFPDSGLSKTAYCKKNAINYNRFFYWIRKVSSKDNKKHASLTTPLIPVQLKPVPDSIKHSIHCGISLKNGAVLHIYDRQSLLIILEKWG